ncbi:hypothetical protein BDY21DRAFT_360842 [Lineolata rhizophorae]|uniref:PD-(D/E)XK nuclease-like domain-containing protein n=1 Tax=Lineolata rhizophorae TaxID=578093 RepID=A0A6A6PA38_9PEZI|nr:hypothetical protein BDY21DRAFT_360842 [Lineolata rhizophorae]
MNIDLESLSRAADASDKQRALDRKADYTLSYSHDESPFESLYARLLQHGNKYHGRVLRRSSPPNGDKLEAEYQLSIWIAASMRKKAKLGRRASLPDTICLVELGFTVVGHELYCYIVYLESDKGDTLYILEFGNAATSSVSGIFKRLMIWWNVIEYDVDEGLDGFWGLLDRLYSNDDKVALLVIGHSGFGRVEKGEGWGTRQALSTLQKLTSEKTAYSA